MASAPITETSKEKVALNWIFCIYYPVQFNKEKVKVLINSVSKVGNIMTPIYIAKLGLKVCCTNVKALKIDGSIFKIFELVLASL